MYLLILPTYLSKLVQFWLLKCLDYVLIRFSTNLSNFVARIKARKEQRYARTNFRSNLKSEYTFYVH